MGLSVPAVSGRSVGAALGAILGEEGLVDDATALDRAAIDGQVPRWLARPSSVEQVASVLALAHDERLAVVPRGSGSALGLGFAPEHVDLVLDLARLDRVLEWNPDDLTATVEAGVTIGALGKHLAPHRQFLPLDPAGGDTRTIGGVAATNATGPLRVRYGGMRDLLLGVRFVQANGLATWGGAKVVKSVSGYDVPKLMVGALGTLGVLCHLTLRLQPWLDVERTWLAAFSGPDRAQALVGAVIDSTLAPHRVEWLNAAALARFGAPPAAAAVAISIGSVEAAVATQGDTVRDLVRREQGQVAEVSPDWWERYAARPGDDPIALRVSTLPSNLSATLGEIEQGFPGAAVTGCAAVGSLDVSARIADADARRGIDALRAFLAPVRGHVVVTRAPLSLKASIDPWGPLDDGQLGLMRAIKAEFDPSRVLNPGRFVGRL